MDGHFRAFSFVDRITRVQPGVSIQGRYVIPSGVTAFPASLVAEAVGQLAAWAAMAAVDFSHRPVAGIAGRIEMLAAVHPGQVLDLTAELESVDEEAAGYRGAAQVDGMPVICLEDCVGPMMPVPEFDDPQCLRDRFALIKGAGASPGAFAGLPGLDMEPLAGEPKQLARALLRIPLVAPFFADHFPRRPVFPGTLLMHAKLQTAAMLAAEVASATNAPWLPRVISDVKLRTFIAPGECLNLEARRTSHSDHSLAVLVESRVGPRLISSAEIEFVPEVRS